MTRINVTLSAYEGDNFPNADELFEAFVLAELTRQHPTAKIAISTAQGGTRAFVDGAPDQDLAQEIGADWWEQFCAGSEVRPATIYVVEYRASVGISVTWECPGTRSESSFGTEAEAKAAIEALRGLGDEWTDADYRVTEVRS